MAKCFVSYVDTSGIRHSVEVEAESMYEAAALGVQAFKEHDCAPSAMSVLEIEIRKSITHSLSVQKLHQWVNGGCKSPSERVTKEKLKALLT